MSALERTLQFLLSSVGSSVSATNIASTLGSTSHTTISNYINYLTKAYLFYRAQRYDIKGKRLLQTQEKYYTADLGLRAVLLSESVGADRGHKLENTVFLELLRRGGEVRIGKQRDSEVDFLVQHSSGQRSYYQVAYTAAETSTLERELRPLLALKDNYPKYLISTDLGHDSYQGIQHINVADWLLESVDSQ
jgi:predicted AAA+ superfamily ATPase